MRYALVLFGYVHYPCTPCMLKTSRSALEALMGNLHVLVGVSHQARTCGFLSVWLEYVPTLHVIFSPSICPGMDNACSAHGGSVSSCRSVTPSRNLWFSERVIGISTSTTCCLSPSIHPGVALLCTPYERSAISSSLHMPQPSPELSPFAAI